MTLFQINKNYEGESKVKSYMEKFKTKDNLDNSRKERFKSLGNKSYDMYLSKKSNFDNEKGGAKWIIIC